ncbi:MAG: ABC transporter permease, partial [Pseudomonadota bacterium]
VLLSILGLLTAIFADRFDQMSAITNFIITPLSFLSGTFYSVTALPAAFQAISHGNPFFYLIDGFRYGALGVGDSNPWTGLAVVTGLNVALWLITLRWLRSGYRLKP